MQKILFLPTGIAYGQKYWADSANSHALFLDALAFERPEFIHR